jgi:hypothetical protein
VARAAWARPARMCEQGVTTCVTKGRGSVTIDMLWWRQRAQAHTRIVIRTHRHTRGHP